MVTVKDLATIQPTKAELLLIATIRQEIEQGKLVTYWKVGKHIKKHLLKNKDRANYGATLFPLLAENLKIDVTTLYRSVTFYEEYPKILATWQELTWSHMRLLLAITDIEQRKALEKQVKKEHLSVSELTALIHHSATNELPKTKPILEVTRTAPYVYQTKQIQGKDMVDLGFNVFLESKTFQEKGSIRLHLNSMPHYTYKAFVLEVHRSWTTQKLRFRGINSEEIGTKEGRTAQDYVINALKDCKFVAIKTSWRDKYTRYLVDIFYDKDEQDLLKLINNGKFLNQELLDIGLAVEYI